MNTPVVSAAPVPALDPAARASTARTTSARRLRHRLQLRLDKPRLPALRERDLDRVEVARDDGVLEHGARLLAHVAREVARGEVGEREQLDAGVVRQFRGLARGAVPGVARTG